MCTKVTKTHKGATKKESSQEARIAIRAKSSFHDARLLARNNDKGKQKQRRNSSHALKGVIEKKCLFDQLRFARDN